LIDEDKLGPKKFGYTDNVPKELTHYQLP
jgi:hypothetical protein